MRTCTWEIGGLEVQAFLPQILAICINTYNHGALIFLESRPGFLTWSARNLSRGRRDAESLRLIRPTFLHTI